MTLRELFQRLGEHPEYIIFYFAIIPIMAFLAGILGKGEGHLSPWRYLYSTLIFFVCVPGILSIALSVYNFMFSRGSILDTDIFAQVLPVVSMVVTLLLIRRNVDLDYIPGFERLSGLVTMITATFFIMWFFDRARIIVFSYLPFQYVILIFAALLIAIRYGWRKAFVRG